MVATSTAMTARSVSQPAPPDFSSAQWYAESSARAIVASPAIRTKERVSGFGAVGMEFMRCSMAAKRA